MQIRSTAKQDPARFVDDLYSRHATELLGFFARRTFDVQVAFDLVAETFAIVLEEQATCRGRTDSARRSWLYGIAHNLLAGFYRSGEIEQRAVRRLAIETPRVSEESIERVEQLADLGAARKLMAQAMATLTDEHREALRLRVIEERSYPEVAAELSVSEQTARARVSRALSSLRDALDGEDDVLKEAIEHV